MLASPADPMSEGMELPPREEIPAAPGAWVRWVTPLIVSALALLFAALVAMLIQVSIARLTGVSLDVTEAPMAPETFLLGALGIDAGLLAASMALFVAFPGTIRPGVNRRDLVYALASFAVVFSVNLLASWGMQAVGESYTGLPEIPHGVGGVVLILAAAIVAPSAEELFFREALLSRVFAGSSRGFAIAVTSLAFGALHWSAGGPLLLATLTGMGVVLGMLRVRTGSLGAAILVHGTNNLAAILLALSGAGTN